MVRPARPLPSLFVQKSVKLDRPVGLLRHVAKAPVPVIAIALAANAIADGGQRRRRRRVNHSGTACVYTEITMRYLATLVLATSAAAGAADLPYVNWENHPLHALDLSPDRKLLAVAHTADQRVQLFDVSTDPPVPAGHVFVGVDPVSVRFRSNAELWVVNHVSDSVSVIDVATRRVRATLATADEPFDVVFAGDRAFVSCSQANRVLVFDTGDLQAAPRSVEIGAEDPRGLAVSTDGREVYAAIWESGNASTVLGGGLVNDMGELPNVVSDPRGPYGGRNPPPNAGTLFEPAVNPAAFPPRVGLIVRRNDAGRWRDDNIGDWTDFVSGVQARASGRAPGWNLPDRDIAVIDATTLEVRYVSGLMNIGMAIAVNPASGEITLVGTDALNEVRFEPNINGRFLRVEFARVGAAANGSKVVRDLNPHLDYRAARVSANLRGQSLGDPRALVWRADGMRGWIAGLGSNNVIAIDASGSRVGAPIAVGEGPAGLALDDARARLYVWNHFAASLSVIDTSAEREISRTPSFNPLPVAIRAGRPFLYDTQRTSGPGMVSCASCHVDARIDRLAWDLGDPAAPPQLFAQNCQTTLGAALGQRACEDFHAMKGPMTTQTMQDIIGHEPFHWRGDRAGIEAFNPTYVDLLGDDVQLTGMEMQLFENFLATITFPPNPFRTLDNALPSQLALDGQLTSGRFAPAGQPLPAGNAVRGLQMYTRGLLDSPFQCASCHTLPTGMAVNGPLFLGLTAFPVGGSVMANGPHGENHLGIVSVDGSTNVSIKVPQLRNLYEKVGFERTRADSAAGAGFLHDGSVDSIASFFSARAFSVRSDQDVADLVALMMAFSGSEFGDAQPPTGAPVPLSRDTHAAVGAQATLAGSTPQRALDLLALARLGKIDLIARSATVGYSFDRSSDRFVASDGTPSLQPAALQQQASSAAAQVWTGVPAGLGRRLGIDRDGDGIADGAEIAQGSNPADAQSRTLRATAGLWFNPQRSGHGIDVQHAGDALSVIWYTYESDGSPTWYLAAAPRANPWRAELRRFTWDAAGATAQSSAVGELLLSFDDARRATFAWRLGSRSGSERMEAALRAEPPANPDRTGTWFGPAQPGWGLSLFADGASRVAVAYVYDSSGQPRWALGQGGNASSQTVPMLLFAGFCPDCAYSAPTTRSAGSITLRFDGARRGALATDLRVDGAVSIQWSRDSADIVPLTEPPLMPAQL